MIFNFVGKGGSTDWVTLVVLDLHCFMSFIYCLNMNNYTAQYFQQVFQVSI